MGSLQLHFVLGLLMVLTYSSVRFNIPADNRSFTTARRYYAGLTLYLASQLFLYYLLWVAIFVSVMVAWRFAERESLEQLLYPGSPLWVSSPLWIGLIAAVVLPKIPPLSAVDTWLRSKIQTFIGIPRYAAELSSKLLGAELSVPESVKEEALSFLARNGYDPNSQFFKEDRSLRALWLRVSTLFQIVRNWDSDRLYSKCVRSAARDFNDIRNRYDRLVYKVSRMSEIADGIAKMKYAEHVDSVVSVEDIMERDVYEDFSETERMLDEIVITTTKGLRDDLDSLHRDIAMFIARAVLSKGLTRESRYRRLKKIGLVLPELQRRKLGPLGLAFTIYGVCLFVMFAILGSLFAPADIGKGLIMGVMIATIQVIALIVAVYPKLHYGFANEDILGRRPYKFFVAAGLIAVVLAIPVRHVFISLAHFWIEYLQNVRPFGEALAYGWDQALREFIAQSPWLLMPFSTAIVMSVLVQDDFWGSNEPLKKQRVKDGSVVAVCMIVAVIIVQLGLGLTGGEKQPLPVLLLVAAIIGLAIGYVVPSSFRSSPLPHRTSPGAAELPV
jgi:hypothetical protein